MEYMMRLAVEPIVVDAMMMLSYLLPARSSIGP
jgi:hypothetical protein